MPIATHTPPSRLTPATPAPELTRLTETLEHIARDIASTTREPRDVGDLGCAIRHLEAACESLAAATTSMADAATSDSTGGPRTATPTSPTTRAVSWRLHHLSQTLSASRDACAVVCLVADAFDASVDDARDTGALPTV
jgi:hypothetical protein